MSESCSDRQPRIPLGRNEALVSLTGRRTLGWLDDAVLLLLGALLFPVAIILIGAPFALLVRGVLEIVRRF
jgi:hypothetical protein